MDNGGEVTLVTPVVSDESWIGLHDVAFEVFLVDLDPEAQVMTWTLDFGLSILVEMAIVDDQGAEIVGSLLRKSPVAADPIAPSYSAFLGEVAILEFNFEDPLVKDTSQELDIEGL